MKAWMNKLSGVLLASLLTVMLNGKAYANNEGASEPPATEIHESAEAPATPATADPVPVVTEALAPAPAAPVAAPVAPVVADAAPVEAPVSAPAEAPVLAPAATVAEPVAPVAQEAPIFAEAAHAPAAEPVVEAVPEAPFPVTEPVVEAVPEAPTPVTEPADETKQEESVAVEVEVPEAEPAAEIPAIANPTTESIVELSASTTPAEAPAETPIETTDETTVETLVETPGEFLEFVAEVPTVESETTVLPEDSAALDRNVQLRAFAAIPVEQASENNASGGASTVETTLPLRKLSASPALLGASAPDADGGSKSGGTDPEEKDPENKQPDEKAPDESDTDTLASEGKKAATRTASSSVSVFSQNEDGSYMLVNHQGAETLSADGDVTINAAGLNRLKTISVNGNINLVGTGILLVDKIEMAEGKEFFLQPNKEIYGENGGSVAVFLKQDNGDYLLLNGSVDGILDEEYEIPAGVTLVVPGGSRLVMQSVAVIEHTSSKGEKTIYYSLEGESQAAKQLPGYASSSIQGFIYEGTADYLSTSPRLTILEKAKLVIREQAALILNGISLRMGLSEVPTLDVKGTLELGGTVESSGIKGIVEISGTVTGTGHICNEEIIVHSDQTALNVENSLVMLRDAPPYDTGSDALSIGTLTAYGSNDLIFNDSNIGNLVLDDGAWVWSGGYEESCIITLGNISGSGTMVYARGTFTTGTVAGTVKEELLTRKPLIRGGVTYVAGPKGMVAVPEVTQSGSIPVVNALISAVQWSDGIHYNISVGENEPQDSGSGSQNTQNGSQTSGSASQNRGSISFDGDSVTYKELVAKLFPKVPSDPGSWIVSGYIEVYTTGSDGRIEIITLMKSDENVTTTIPTASIRLIRTVVFARSSQNSGGGTSTSTNTAFTGSGILGGSGAGSLSGGNSTMILRGIGLHQDDPTPDPNPKPIPIPTPDPKPDPDPDPKPDPDPDPTPDPDPAPDPDPEPEPEPEPLIAYLEDAEEEAPLVWAELAPSLNADAVSPIETQYVVLALEGEKTLEELGGRATVSMDYTPPAEYAGKTLYVVFRNEDGSLIAIRATYSDITGLLRFITDRLGTFMVVGFDFDGEEFSEEFYAALAEIPELRDLIFAEFSPV